MAGARSRILSFVGIAAAILLVLGFIYRGPIERIYSMATFADPDKLARNVMRMETLLDSRAIPASSAPSTLPVAARKIELPPSFGSFDETVDTEAFLDKTCMTGLLVMHAGEIVFEEYRRGLTPETTQFSFSMAKSFTSALIGAAIDDGLIDSEDDRIVKYLPEFAGTGWAEATIANTLENASGIDFEERHDGSASDIDAFRRHFALGRPITDFLLGIGPDREPGTFNGYNSMDAQLLGVLLSRVLGDRTISDYAAAKIWEPTGMTHAAAWTTGGAGQELTLGGMNATLRSYARFGQLYLQRGEWNGEQVLPADWIDRSTRPDAPHLMPGEDNPLSTKPYGYKWLWWTPIVPVGGDYYSSGIYNQFIYIQPSSNVVIAVLSANHHYTENPNFWKTRYNDFLQAVALHVTTLAEGDETG